MNEEPRLSAATTALVVIDAQEKLAAAMPERERARCVRTIDMLLEAARLFGMPALLTEQYPKGLGRTLPELTQRLETFEEAPRIIEKVEFDANANGDFAAAFDHLMTRQGEGAVRNVVVTGMEAHICVYQTVRGFSGSGYRVLVPYDATCSRNPGDRQIARELWAQAGAVVTSTETLLFELLGSAKHQHFRAISKLIR